MVVGVSVIGSLAAAANGIDRIRGLPAALLILDALTVTPRSRAVAAVLLILGPLPLAVTTWWSVATPLLAVPCPLLGRPQRSRTTGAKTLPG